LIIIASAADIQYHHDVDVRNETQGFTRPLRTRHILAQGATPSALGKPNRKVHEQQRFIAPFG